MVIVIAAILLLVLFLKLAGPFNHLNNIKDAGDTGITICDCNIKMN